MISIINPKMFVHDLCTWYRANKRDLVFRHERDPYKIFISEMMLQQTQVVTMLPYYERFINAFPNVQSLAEADFSQVLKLWEGLGYYRRARYVHETAKMIVEVHHGVFPSDLASIRALKGVGRYTAGAIHSIAFDEPTPAVDGNVLRVVSRLTRMREAIDETKTVRKIETLLASWITYDTPSDFTQAMMELGALVCKKQPLCASCPVSNHCEAYKHEDVVAYPVQGKRLEKTVEHYHVFAVYDSNHHYLLRKRPDNGLLANMLEFPQYLTDSLDHAKAAFNDAYGNLCETVERTFTVKHTFTHKDWVMNVHVCKTTRSSSAFQALDKLRDAMSRAHLKIARKL